MLTVAGVSTRRVWARSKRTGPLVGPPRPRGSSCRKGRLSCRGNQEWSLRCRSSKEGPSSKDVWGCQGPRNWEVWSVGPLPLHLEN